VKLSVTPERLRCFLEDLWKDQRVLELTDEGGIKVLRRHRDFQTAIDEEHRFLERLRAQVTFRIPRLISHSPENLTFEYIAGTRAFNLFMDLKILYRQTRDQRFLASALQLAFLLAEDLKEFQRVVVSDPVLQSLRRSYPAREKLANVYRLLISALPSTIPFESIAEDLDRIAVPYCEHTAVAFRDATPKNVILLIPALYQTRFQTYHQRLEQIQQMVFSGEMTSRLIQEHVYHIDFSGCLFGCPMSDDWVALRQHEGTEWLSPFLPDVETEESPLDLCVKFVRFTRFGGRKLAYRLFNRDGYQIRFHHDHEAYYFQGLKDFSRQLTDWGVIKNGPAWSAVLDLFLRACDVVPAIDYVHTQTAKRSRYYRDVFPY
jgi:hypothetical protein